MNLVQAQLPGHCLAHRLGVAGEHNGLADPRRLQGGDALGGVGLHLVRDDDVAQIDPLGGHVDGGAHSVAGVPGHACSVHQLVVSDTDLHAVHRGLHALTGDLLHAGHPAGVQLGAVGLPQGLGDGVFRPAFRQRGQLQQLGLRALVRVDGGDVEHPLGQGAGLIEYQNLGICQDLQVIAALDQDAGLGGPADAAEKAEGHRDDQGAGAGDHQKDEGAVETVGPGHQAQQRRQRGQKDGGDDHHRGVVPGEFGDKVLGLGLLAAGVFHQVQDLGHRGRAELLGHPHPQQARQVDAARDHVVAGLHLPGQGLAGEGGGVHRGAALQHHAVQGDALPGLDDDGVPHRHGLRVHLLQSPAPLQIGIVGPNVHQRSDGLAGAVHGVALEELAHLIEQHDKDRLGVLPGEESADGGQRHQKILVKDLAVGDVARRPPQHVVADDGVREKEGAQADRTLQVQQRGRRQQRGADQDAPEHFFLLFSHKKTSIGHSCGAGPLCSGLRRG
ncbi:Uncharacterised protein [Flavonifractor plautii]|nr:Uncharacterised protein [Flavonifractor plautii]